MNPSILKPLLYQLPRLFLVVVVPIFLNKESKDAEADKRQTSAKPEGENP